MAKSENFLIRIDPELNAWIEAEAEKRDRSKAWIVAHAVELWRSRLENARARARAAAKKGRRRPNRS